MDVRWLLLVGMLALGGCDVAQEFEDVSDEPAYRSYVGGEFMLTVEMHLSGVNAPPGYESSVDYYVVNPSVPDWRGPELITRETLPIGTVLRVVSVHRCTNCVFGKSVKARVTLPGYKTRIDLPTHIAVEYLSEEFTRRL